ncbi:hypothetical protein [Wocania arenilitoris]|nr:hypothetical protein [Wocania arenilitoris]
MKSPLKLSKHLDVITKENLLQNRRILSFNYSSGTLWKGTKRYAH